MNCPHCGAPVVPGNRFCNRCRKRVSPEPAPSAAPTSAGSGIAARRPPTVPRPAAPPRTASGSFSRPMVITILGVLNIVGGVLQAGFAAVVAFGALAGPSAAPAAGAGALVAGFAAVFVLVGLVQIATGVGLLGLKPWSRTLQIILAGIGLLGIPCGTIVSILVLVYMLKPEVKLLFSGASPGDLTPEENAMVERLGQGSGAMVALVVVLVLVMGVAMIGIVAAIAIPSLLRARVSANEAATIGDLRTVVSAQAAYASANAGFPDRLECLAEPTRCIPDYPGTAPVFLDRTLLQPDRHGYRFRFVPGTAAQPDESAAGRVSPSSVAGFAYVAEPIVMGQTGLRAFCAAESGLICYDVSGAIRETADGTCPETCEPIR